MANNKTNFTEQATANYWLGKPSGVSTAPSTIYLRLIASGAAFNGETWQGSDTGECAGSTYQNRVQNLNIANSSATWTNDTDGGGKTNKIAFVLTTSAGSDWGTVSRVVITSSYSTGTTGNSLFYSTFAPAVIASGNTVQFTTGSITYSEL